MRVLVAGAHGGVGQHVTRIAAEGGHAVDGMIRDDSQASRIEELGGEPVVADLTEEVDHAVRGQDAIVFAAGSGGEDVWGVDRDGAIRLMEQAEEHGVDRFVMLSSINADTPEESPEALQEYLQAKAEADEHLRKTDLTYTIVRPTTLSDEPGTGQIATAADLDRGDEVPREDVAAALVTALEIEATHGTSFDLTAGNEPIEEALEDPLTGG
ncbi:SDR family oxidoreductase [Halobacteria archaeon AArc-dxtr1]|nr:SDR family oxidoreductase [Halobacteria archaeon AArc-dxtr1]